MPPPTKVQILAQNTSVIPQQTLDHFSTIPIAQPTLQEPNFKCLHASRTVTHEGHGHTLMGATWNTPETIPHLVSLYRRNPPPPPSAKAPYQTPNSNNSIEVRRFYTLGPALNAHPDLLHGGVISCILDSGLGAAVGLSVENKVTFTAQLNVKFEKPVRTPGTVMLRAWVVRVEGGGRKVWAEGVLESLTEEGKWVTHARGEGLWIGKGREGKL